MRIPEEKIEEVRTTANIVDVISQYVQLRKRGKNYIGLCPFHHEKTPSFTVSDEKQIYHCFGCHAGGTIFNFLMEYKNISYIEAVQEVADLVGISIRPEKGQVSGKNELKEELYDINLLTARYFTENLLKSDQASQAREYLQNRKIKPQTQKMFGLGYALAGWENLHNYLAQNKVDLEKARQLGLIESRDSGGYYDKYRDRVIFPIFSTNGRVVAFGGRIMKDNEKAPKYINSPENPIYSKRKVLYGLYHSKEEIRQLNKAILVEGYMDVIALYQQGVKNIVASSGTALTDEQVKLISRFTKNITVLFDADEAGQSASMRSIEILLKNDFDVKVVSLPEGEDPDSYINNYGKAEFETLVNTAQNFLEYQTSILQEQGKFDDPAESTEAIRELVKSAALVKDELKRQIYMKNISRKFNLREKLLESELEKYLERNKTAENRTYQKKPTAKASDNGESGEHKKADPLEKEIVKILFEGKPEVNKIVFENIDVEEIEHELLKELAEIAKAAYEEGLSGTSILIERIKDESLRNAVMKLTMNNDSISKRWEKADKGVNPETLFSKHAYETVKKFRIKKIDAKIQENNRQLSQTQDETEIMNLMKAIKELNNEKRQLLFPPDEE